MRNNPLKQLRRYAAMLTFALVMGATIFVSGASANGCGSNCIPEFPGCSPDKYYGLGINGEYGFGVFGCYGGQYGWRGEGWSCRITDSGCWACHRSPHRD